MWYWGLLLLVHASITYGQEWRLVWEDEFNGGGIDPSKWEHEIHAWGGGVS